MLWLFLFNPTLGIVAHWMRGFGIAWNPLLDGNDALIMVVIAAVWKQISYNFLFFLAGLQSIPKSLIEAAAIDGAGPVKRFATIVFPLLSPTTFFLLVVNIVYAFFDTFGIIDAATRGGPGQGDGDPGLQGVRRRLQGARPRRLGRAVRGPDGDRHHADGGPVPLRRAESAVLMCRRDRRSARPRWRPDEPAADRAPRARRSSAAVLSLIARRAAIGCAFPLYVTFVASTQTAEQVLHAPMPLLPGTHLIDNYPPC